MKRRLLIALFAVGTVVGFGSGLAHLCYRAHAHHGWHSCQRAAAPPAAKKH